MIILPTGTDQKLKKFPAITFSLIVVNTAVYFMTSAGGGDHLHQVFELWAWKSDLSNPAGIVTSMFLHSSFFHLLGNMIFLWTFGALLESSVGRVRYIAYYLAGGMASTALFTIVDGIYRPWLLGVPLVGASGAVSAVMGTFMVRCYFARVKMAVGFSLLYWLPRRIKVNALLVVGLYLAMNLYNGVAALDYYFIPVAYWSHIGGFAFGIGASLASGHVRPARIDKLRLRTSVLLQSRVALRETREGLEKIVEAAPKDGWPLWDLARIETKYRLTEKGERLYYKAFEAFRAEGAMDEAVSVFVEHQTLFKKSLPAGVQFRMARELDRRGEHEQAARALERLLERGGKSAIDPKARERALIMLGRLFADKLECKEAARELFARFLREYPESPARETVETRLAMLEGRAAA